MYAGGFLRFASMAGRSFSAVTTRTRRRARGPTKPSARPLSRSTESPQTWVWGQFSDHQESDHRFCFSPCFDLQGVQYCSILGNPRNGISDPRVCVRKSPRSCLKQWEIWVWVNIKPPGIRPQALVHVSIYQGSILGLPYF